MTSTNTHELTDEVKPDPETVVRGPVSDEGPDSGGEARGRAHAREDSSPEADSEPETGPVWRRALTRVRSEFRAPEVWDAQPPSCRQLLEYAREEPWTEATGAVRRAGVVWSFAVAIPATFVGYLFAWAFQRPSRTIVLLIVYIVLKQTSLGSILPPWSGDQPTP